jgi:hypothetical protein
MAFGDLPRAVQVQLAAIGPLLFGLVCGFVLALDAAGYWALTALSVVGGVAGGTEHRAVRTAALRGLIAGACFGLGVVVADGASGRPALAPVPSPTGLLVVISAVAGALLAAAGARLRAG